MSSGPETERVAGYKKLDDWVRIVDIKFGQIRNPIQLIKQRRVR